jgi:hypothetical protein
MQSAAGRRRRLGRLRPWGLDEAGGVEASWPGWRRPGRRPWTRSVVYVPFGSVAEPDAVQMAEMAEGLHSSGKAFVWVVTCQGLGDLEEDT